LATTQENAGYDRDWRRDSAAANVKTAEDKRETEYNNQFNAWNAQKTLEETLTQARINDKMDERDTLFGNQDRAYNAMVHFRETLADKLFADDMLGYTAGKEAAQFGYNVGVEQQRDRRDTDYQNQLNQISNAQKIADILAAGMTATETGRVAAENSRIDLQNSEVQNAQAEKRTMRLTQFSTNENIRGDIAQAQQLQAINMQQAEMLNGFLKEPGGREKVRVYLASLQGMPHQSGLLTSLGDSLVEGLSNITGR
jgi:hypothetical protein